ncbi:hypothetical protein F5148DRAFT_1152979 [Russula earlei]|uniref:Uncharacterized protein n=1 Tax=Russula earlei TaxID=71964 RepID=A0ACC0TUN5_9AGAM|nr:hypothetical protein F5148DRAFT_1152979 [Russula earlei]
MEWKYWGDKGFVGRRQVATETPAVAAGEVQYKFRFLPSQRLSTSNCRDKQESRAQQDTAHTIGMEMPGSGRPNASAKCAVLSKNQEGLASACHRRTWKYQKMRPISRAGATTPPTISPEIRPTCDLS